ncbi:hypothetical protein ACFL2J_07960 [Candidatus Omnitrophota bacterium]
MAAADANSAGLLSAAKFSEIGTNTAKAGNVSTTLDAGTITATTYGITSDGGADDILLAEADSNSAGLLSAAKFSEIGTNTAKAGNVSTTLDAGTITATTYGITSDGGADDILLAEADSNSAGLLSATKFDEIVANTARASLSDFTWGSGSTINWTFNAGATVPDPFITFLDGPYIGIGTTNPSATLDVVGSIKVSGSMNIPVSTDPTATADGHIGLESDVDAIKIQAGSGVDGGIAVNQDVRLPLIEQKDMTIIEPDNLDAFSTNGIPMFTVDSYNYPDGITITAIRVITSESTSIEFDLEEWETPAAFTSKIADISLTTSDEDTFTGGEITDTTVKVGSYVFLDLDNTDIAWVKVTVWFYADNVTDA